MALQKNYQFATALRGCVFFDQYSSFSSDSKPIALKIPGYLCDESQRAASAAHR